MRSSATDPVLSERAQRLFRLLVERYIREGKPVGSRTLSRDSGLDLSPATIRNVMSDLEELGLVKSPHTSAGRVPTAAGYRLFVDTLLQVAPLDALEVEQLRNVLVASGAEDRDHLMESASSLLSEVTRLAGIVMLPRQDQVTLRQVEFISLSEEQVLVVLVTSDREVQNRIIQTDRPFSGSELHQAASYINQIVAGRDLRQVRERVLEELQQHRESMNQMMLSAIEMAARVFPEQPVSHSDFVVAGQSQLMSYEDLSNVGKLRSLFEAFEKKRHILHLLDRSLNADGVQIFIGEESGYAMLDECSVVTSPYEVDGRVVGVLGVIGPTRMAYERVIPIVDITARLLGAALNRAH